MDESSNPLDIYASQIVFEEAGYDNEVDALDGKSSDWEDGMSTKLDNH